MDTSPANPDEYIASLPDERRDAIAAVRELVQANLPQEFEEGMGYGMIAWYVPLARFPDTYNKQPLNLAALGNQKNHMALYLNNVYGDRETEAWFKERYAESGKNLDMGKSCLRFRKVDDLAIDVIADTIARADLETFVDRYKEARGSSRKTRAARRAQT
ncbi:MAG TPA: DUF1801 domain-containing protein [Dehalococcoidia bacterium]|nr:DUF1801 domain-containing protein [Dehalococcoidia bacterium]